MIGERERPVHPGARRGRGAASNDASRFDRERRVPLDDGWGNLDEAPPPLRTELTQDASRTIIARNNSPDISFDQSINPYRGCEHGCVYCFARPTHAYLGLSPGLDFESRLLFKPDAAKLLRRELSRPGYRCRTIAIGTNTDPYQPIEAKLGVTRQILEVLAEHRHPVGIVTKSHLVTRDIDLLREMAGQRLVKVAVSITTLDRRLARRMEPRAPTPGRRLDTIRLLSEAGIPAGVMMAPMIPALNDSEIEALLERAAEAGAKEAGYVLLRLPLEIRDLWSDWLRENYPDRAARVMRLLREARGGRDYDAAWGQRMLGGGPYAQMIARRFRLACTRLGLNRARLQLDAARFHVPQAADGQLTLL